MTYNGCAGWYFLYANLTQYYYASNTQFQISSQVLKNKASGHLEKFGHDALIGAQKARSLNELILMLLTFTLLVCFNPYSIKTHTPNLHKR